MLKNQIREQKHAVTNICEIQIDKLTTQQINDELQLQKNKFNIADNIMSEIKSNECYKKIYILKI